MLFKNLQKLQLKKKEYHRTLSRKKNKDNVNQDFEKYETNKKTHLKLNAYLKR